MAQKNKTAGTQWPATKIERRPLDGLKDYERNARTHSPEQIEQIANSIREFGWTIPVLIGEDGTIIAGHARVAAARQLGLKEAPVIVARGWSEAQRRAYVLADNKLAENAGWDKDLLVLELGDLDKTKFDLTKVGFSPQELQDLVSELDSRGGFLDDIIAADEAEDDEAGDSNRTDGLVTLNLAFTPGDRDRVVEYLGTLRDEHGLKTAADALLMLARERVALSAPA